MGAIGVDSGFFLTNSKALAYLLSGKVVMRKKSHAGKLSSPESSRPSSTFPHLLKALEEQVDQLFEETTFGTYLTDDAGRCLSINNQALKWIGCSRESILGRLRPLERAAAQNWAKLRECRDYLRAHPAMDMELELVDTQGDHRQFKFLIQHFPAGVNLSPTHRSVFYDITEYKRTRERNRIAAIAFESQMGICIADQNERVLEANSAFSAMTGYATGELRGKKYDVFFSNEKNADLQSSVTRSLGIRGLWEGEIRARRKDGSKFIGWANISCVPITATAAEYYVVCLYDITTNKAIQEEIHHLAYFDTLTQLPNRRKLNDRLSRALSIFPRSHLHGAVLFIDLDNFKAINDTKGHASGDLLLVEVGQRLQHAVREGDMVARVGGDEFVVLLGDLSANVEEASYQANLIGSKIQNALAVPFKFDDVEFNSGGSIGISIFGHGDQAEDVLQQADMAMYRAKREGRNAVCFFDPTMKKAAAEYQRLAHELGLVIELNQLELFYQPQFSHDGEIRSAEALLRWHHPARGLVSPGAFMPLAEESGLILPIGLWVLAKACEKLRQWQSDPVLSTMQIAVNVSSRQFRDQNFVDSVVRMIEDSGVNASQLRIELAESMMLEADHVREKMDSIRHLGVKFTLDDFGTGCSPLSSLIKLPLDQLKIDRSFVTNMLSNGGDIVMVKMIVAMAKNLGVEVIAEGLETESEREFLHSIGCSLYQGYLLSPPLPGGQFEDLIRSLGRHGGRKPVHA